MNDEIKKASMVLQEGGIVIFPTDTAFGIGCRIDKRESVDRLFRIRKRPLTQPTPVLTSSIEQILPYLEPPSDIVRRFMQTHWPGALTIITPCKKERIYSPIRGNGDTIGVRMPDHSDLLEVMTTVGVPIIGPSANMHGEKTPFHMADLDPILVNLVDYVMPGACKIHAVSTVIDCTKEPYVVVRKGAVAI